MHYVIYITRSVKSTVEIRTLKHQFSTFFRTHQFSTRFFFFSLFCLGLCILGSLHTSLFLSSFHIFFFACLKHNYVTRFKRDLLQSDNWLLHCWLCDGKCPLQREKSCEIMYITIYTYCIEYTHAHSYGKIDFLFIVSFPFETFFGPLNFVHSIDSLFDSNQNASLSFFWYSSFYLLLECSFNWKAIIFVDCLCCDLLWNCVLWKMRKRCSMANKANFIVTDGNDKRTECNAIWSRYFATFWWESQI